jgi:hypothetical protein
VTIGIVPKEDDRIPSHGWCAPDETSVYRLFLHLESQNASTNEQDKKPGHRWYPQEPKYKYVAMAKLTVARMGAKIIKRKISWEDCQLYMPIV